MQVRFIRVADWTAKISRIKGTELFDEKGDVFTNGFAWEVGGYEIEWTPPTDDERALFLKAAEHLRLDDVDYDDCGPWCKYVGWYETFGTADNHEVASIAESLAMDGS
jgi:hypothetical protein